MFAVATDNTYLIMKMQVLLFSNMLYGRRKVLVFVHDFSAIFSQWSIFNVYIVTQIVSQSCSYIGFFYLQMCNQSALLTLFCLDMTSEYEHAGILVYYFVLCIYFTYFIKIEDNNTV